MSAFLGHPAEPGACVDQRQLDQWIYYRVALALRSAPPAPYVRELPNQST